MESSNNLHTQTIMFISCYKDEFEFQLKVADRLKRYGIKSFFVTAHRNSDAGSEDCAVIGAWEGVHKFKSELTRLKPAEVLRQLRGIEKEYNVYDSRRLAQAHAVHNKRILEEGLAVSVLTYFKFWQSVINEKHIDLIFGGEGGELLRTTAIKVAHKRGVKRAINFWMPFPGMLGLINDPINIEDEYAVDVKNKGITREEKEKLSELITNIRRSKYDYVKMQKRVIKKRHILNFFSSAWRKYICRDPNYIQFNIAGRVKKLLCRCVNKTLFTFLHQRPRQENFVFYPIHSRDDAQLALRAPQYYLHQVYLIEQIAKSLPIGYKLYVKEHPAEIGGCSFREMRSLLKRCPNVRVISPYVHPHYLIRNCDAVITINSTTGFESIVFKKPTVVLGKVFYAGKGLTVDVDNLYELPEKIAQALEFKFSESDLLKFACTTARSCYPGRCMSVDSSEHNAFQIADSLLQVLKSCS